MEPNPRARLTYDDFLLFPDEWRRHELIDGEHYVMPLPNVRHQWTRDLPHADGAWLVSHPVGRSPCTARRGVH